MFNSRISSPSNSKPAILADSKKKSNEQNKKSCNWRAIFYLRVQPKLLTMFRRNLDRLQNRCKCLCIWFFILRLTIKQCPSRKNDRESRTLSSESERHSKLSHEMEKDLHRLEKDEIGLQNSLQNQKRLAEDISRMKEEISALLSQTKVVLF